MPESISLSGKTFDRYLANLTGAEFKVYIALLREADKPGVKRTRLSRKELALRTGLSGRYVGIVLRTLESRGLVQLKTSEMGILIYAELHENIESCF